MKEQELSIELYVNEDGILMMYEPAEQFDWIVKGIQYTFHQLSFLPTL